jgi:propanol-preferring alcohol dehydrogenase
MAKMKAMQVSKPNGPFELVERDIPTPGPHWVRVKVTAPSSDAMQSTIDGLRPRGKLVIVAAPFTPLSVNAMGLLSGKQIAGWPSGSSIDSEDAMAFSALTGVRPKTQTFKLEQAEQAFAAMMENKVRFRAVLVP